MAKRPTLPQSPWLILFRRSRAARLWQTKTYQEFGRSLGFSRLVSHANTLIETSSHWSASTATHPSLCQQSRYIPVLSRFYRSLCRVISVGDTCDPADQLEYQSPNGGRVFFDDLGWPWPKHPCTDNQGKAGRPTKEKRRGNIFALRSRDGSQLALYDLDDFEE